MPYKCEKIKLSKDQDRRVKLTDKQREEIKLLHKEGNSIHSLSRDYGVSRRTIQFILFPERQQRNVDLRDERGGSKIYYDREKNTDCVRKHRRYKHKLFKDGKLLEQ